MQNGMPFGSFSTMQKIALRKLHPPAWSKRKFYDDPRNTERSFLHLQTLEIPKFMAGVTQPTIIFNEVGIVTKVHTCKMKIITAKQC